MIRAVYMRAEELINCIYKQKADLLKAGNRAEKIVMSRTNYDLLEDYRRKLPPFPPGIPDYLTQYTLFGLPIFIDNSYECEVKRG